VLQITPLNLERSQSQKILGPIMKKLSTSWLLVLAQVTNTILFVLGPMSYALVENFTYMIEFIINIIVIKKK
jgi:hypothetical protein